jgi:hypothetical protein
MCQYPVPSFLCSMRSVSDAQNELSAGLYVKLYQASSRKNSTGLNTPGESSSSR